MPQGKKQSSTMKMLVQRLMLSEVSGSHHLAVDEHMASFSQRLCILELAWMGGRDMAA